jgi:RNA polymerase sigma-70 factor, ECF subfamily
MVTVEMTDTTSLTLLQRVRSSEDQLAWNRFVDLYSPFIFEWGRRAGLTDVDAADLSQDVLILLLVELPRFEYSPDRGRFRGWLRTVTVNKCRERQRRHHLAIASTSDSYFSEFEDSSAGNEFWDREYRQHLVSRALQLMQTDFETRVWQAAWKQIVDEERAADVAAELGISLAAAYQARSRVLRRLREELQDLLD